MRMTKLLLALALSLLLPWSAQAQVDLTSIQAVGVRITPVSAVNGAGVATGSINLSATSCLSWGTPPDVFLCRDAANTLGQRNGTNAQQFSVYGTYTDASNYERIDFMAGTAPVILTNQAGTGVARSLSIGTVGAQGINLTTTNTPRWQVTSGGNLVNISTGFLSPSTNLAWSPTAPTIASGFCTSPAISASNGTAAFTITIGTACAASVGTLTLPAATTGWVCAFSNVTVPQSNTPSQTGGTTTTVTVTNYARTTGIAANWADSNVLRASCTGY